MEKIFRAIDRVVKAAEAMVENDCWDYHFMPATEFNGEEGSYDYLPPDEKVDELCSAIQRYHEVTNKIYE
jgi:hypothetical protein